MSLAETRDAEQCSICGRTLTESEQARLAADGDFVEHGGHLIRVEHGAADCSRCFEDHGEPGCVLLGPVGAAI